MMLDNSFLLDCVNKAGLGGAIGNNNLQKIKTPEEKSENELDI
jgi:hypothetical protein